MDNEFANKTAEEIADSCRALVEENAHGAALAVVAEWFENQFAKKRPNECNVFAAFRAALVAINEEHERVGHLTWDAAEMRNQFAMVLRRKADLFDAVSAYTIWKAL